MRQGNRAPETEENAIVGSPDCKPITKEVVEEICKDIERGVPLVHSVAASGVDRREFNQKLHDGKKYENSKHRWLAERIETAQSIAVRDKVTQATPQGDPLGARWWLERRSKEFQPKTVVALENQSEIFADIVLEEERSLLSDLNKMGAGDKILDRVQNTFFKIIQRNANVDEDDAIEGIVVEVKQLKEGSDG